jgi:Ring finger domain
LLEADDPVFHSKQGIVHKREQQHRLGQTNTFSPNEVSVPGLRLLQEEHNHTNSNSLENAVYHTASNILSNSTTTTLILARECECFVEENYEMVVCPFSTNMCGQVLDNHRVNSDGKYPETVNCFSEALQKGDTNMHRNLWLFVMIVWGFFLAMMVLTPQGRSCMSFLPSRVMGYCFHWNGLVADYLLAHRPERAKTMIRNHILLRRRQLYRELSRAWRQEQREARQQGAQNPNQPVQEQDNIELVVTPSGEVMDRNLNGEDGLPTTISALPRRKPTALALKTQIYQGHADRRGASIVNENVGNNDNDEDLDGNPQCAICFCDLVEGSDRVGVLPCQHIFHVEPCLKGWLARGNNSCPFCRLENVAAERYHEEEEITAHKNDGNEEFQSHGVASTNGDTEATSEISSNSLSDPENRSPVQERDA